MSSADDPAATPPLPDPDPLTQFYWDGANEHKLMILRCQDCGHYIHYPRPVCNACLSVNLAPAQVSGRGTLYTYTLPMQPNHPYFQARVPYIYAVIALPEEENLKVVDERDRLPGGGSSGSACRLRWSLKKWRRASRSRSSGPWK